jgi:hypothetical protein
MTSGFLEELAVWIKFLKPEMFLWWCEKNEMSME